MGEKNCEYKRTNYGKMIDTCPQTTTDKLKIRYDEPHKTGDILRCPGSSLSANTNSISTTKAYIK